MGKRAGRAVRSGGWAGGRRGRRVEPGARRELGRRRCRRAGLGEAGGPERPGLGGPCSKPGSPRRRRAAARPPTGSEAAFPSLPSRLRPLSPAGPGVQLTRPRASALSRGPRTVAGGLFPKCRSDADTGRPKGQPRPPTASPSSRLRLPPAQSPPLDALSPQGLDTWTSCSRGLSCRRLSPGRSSSFQSQFRSHFLEASAAAAPPPPRKGTPAAAPGAAPSHPGTAGRGPDVGEHSRPSARQATGSRGRTQCLLSLLVPPAWCPGPGTGCIYLKSDGGLGCGGRKGVVPYVLPVGAGHPHWHACVPGSVLQQCCPVEYNAVQII